MNKIERNFRISIGCVDGVKKYLDLNESHYQNVLIIGYPGSGKMTILHNVIKHVLNEYYEVTDLKILNIDASPSFSMYQAYDMQIETILLERESETEKIVKFFGTLYNIMKERFNLFHEKGWCNYNQISSTCKIPRIVVIINKFDVFLRMAESNAQMFDVIHNEFHWLVRAGSTVGINFIVEGQMIHYSMRDILNFFRKGILLKGNYRCDYQTLFGWLGYLKEMISIEELEQLKLGEALIYDGDFREIEKVDFEISYDV